MIEYILNAFVFVVCFAAAWYGLSAINYEKLLKANHVKEAQILYFMIVASIAYLAGSFILAFVYR